MKIDGMTPRAAMTAVFLFAAVFAGYSLTPSGNDDSSGNEAQAQLSVESPPAETRRTPAFAADSKPHRRRSTNGATVPRPDLAAPDAPPPLDNSRADESLLAPELTPQQEMELNDEESDARTAQMLDLFNLDERDHEWATQTETSIEDNLSELGDAVLSSVECRSQLCRVEVLHATESGMRRFNQVPRFSALPSGHVRQYLPGEGAETARTVIYGMRSGVQLPPPL